MHSAMISSILTTSLFIGATQASNVWTVNCAPLAVQMSDPIVSPGQLASHVHAIAGGTAFSNLMPDKLSAVNALATTCDKYTDHSNYWCPQLYQMVSGGFKAVPFSGVNSYYENFTCDYHPSGQCDTPRNARAFPPGFRMLAGDTNRRTQNSSDQTNQAILYTSGSQKNVYGIPTVLGTNFQIAVRFPSCWDGVNVDSADHKSHVSYPSPSLRGDTTGGMCPPSHPYALISIGSEFGFSIDGITDPKSLIFSNGDTTGLGFHGDFIQGWTNSTALQESFANCFDNGNCPWRAFGAPGGVEINPTPRTPETQTQTLVKMAVAATQDLGLTDVIPKLPGNNPVWGSGSVVTSSVAAAQTTLATVVAPSSTLVVVTKVPVVATTTRVSYAAATCPPGCMPIAQGVLGA